LKSPGKTGTFCFLNTNNYGQGKFWIIGVLDICVLPIAAVEYNGGRHRFRRYGMAGHGFGFGDADDPGARVFLRGFGAQKELGFDFGAVFGDLCGVQFGGGTVWRSGQASVDLSAV
jgi:hypothetical protein